MLIGIDISPAAKEYKTGIEWYCHHVANELIRLDSHNRYRFYTKSSVVQNFHAFPDNFSEIVLPHRPYWTHTALAQELKHNPVDVFYSPGHIIPHIHPKKTVTTIHDLGFRYHRKNYSVYQYFHAKLNCRLSIKWASHIVTPTRFVADDIASLYKLENKRVKVIANGFEDDADMNMAPPEISSLRNKYGISRNYFIFIGRMDRRKNLLRTLEAYFQLVETREFPPQFVLVGSPGEGYAEITAYIKNQKRKDLIVHTGYTDSPEKAALLRGAIALIFPSLYEGFGIPILEGFAAGTPVLTSSTTSCSEVGGEAALLVNPESVNAIFKGMEMLLLQPSLRLGLIANGKKRASEFSWKHTAKNIHNILINNF